MLVSAPDPIVDAVAIHARTVLGTAYPTEAQLEKEALRWAAWVSCAGEARAWLAAGFSSVDAQTLADTGIDPDWIDDVAVSAVDLSEVAA